MFIPLGYMPEFSPCFWPNNMPLFVSIIFCFRSFIDGWFGWLPHLGCCELCCHNHGCANNTSRLCFCFFVICAQKWVCWIIVLFIVAPPFYINTFLKYYARIYFLNMRLIFKTKYLSEIKYLIRPKIENYEYLNYKI